MAVVEHICDDIAVMYLGKIIERASRRAFTRPLHPQRGADVGRATVSGGREAPRRVRLTGDPPSPVDPPPGCRFAGAVRPRSRFVQPASRPARGGAGS